MSSEPHQSATLRSAVTQAANSSYTAAILLAIVHWCGGILRRSFLFNWLSGQTTTAPQHTLSQALFGKLHAILMAIFRALRLDRLLQGSIFLKPVVWCSLTVISAPLVPTLVVLVLALASFLSLFLSFGCGERKKLCYFPMNKYVYLFAFIYLYATFTSMSVSGSLYKGALSVFFLLFYSVLSTSFTKWSQVRHLLFGLVLAGLLVSAYGFWQYLHPSQYASTWLDTDMFSSISLRVYSTLANPNVLGTYFLLIIPIAAALMFTAPGKLKKLGYLAACGIMTVCLVLTYSRGCYLGLLFAAMIFLVLLDRRFLIVGIIAILLCPLYLPDTIISRFTSIGDMSDSSTSYRVYIWMGVLAMLKDYWFSGVGPGEAAFNTVYPVYSYSAIQAPHAHNLFLQITCETGVCGLIVFVVMLVSFYRTMFTALRRETHRDARIFQIAGISAVSGFLLESMTDYTFYNYRVMLLFWAFLAIFQLFTRAHALKQADLDDQCAWSGDEEGASAEEPADRVRVLNILSDSNIGGAGRCLLNYLKYADRTQYDVSVILPKGSLLTPAVRALNAPVLEADIQGDRSLDPRAVVKLRGMIAAMEPDIVHTHGSMSGRIAARGTRAKLIYTRHSAFPVPESMKHGPKHRANQLITRLYADRIIAVSPATCENLTDSGVPRDKIQVMMNGVEPLTPASEATCAALRAQLGIAPGDFTAGILARLEEYKGHQTILEAARILKSEGRPIKILIGGSGVCEESIKASIQSMGLEDTVLFLGFVKDVSSVLSILKVQLNASYGTEASSLALIEGMSLGLPSVASSYGGNPWQVDDGVDGFLFQPKNAEAMADCLRKLMDDPQLLETMRENTRRIYQERFTGEIFARNIESVYARVIKE